MIIRILLFFSFAGILLGADVEQFTLKDGRKLIGTYDPAAHTLTCLQGGIPISIHVAEEQIADRKPSVVPVIPDRVAPPQKTTENGRPAVGQVQPSTLTKEMVEATAKENEATAQIARDKQAILFQERFGKPYILPIPEDAVRRTIDELPGNLQGSWYEMSYSKERGDEIRSYSKIITSNAGWHYLGRDFNIRNITEIRNKTGELLGHEVDVKGENPYFIRYVATHAVALTIGKETSVFTISKQ